MTYILLQNQVYEQVEVPGFGFKEVPVCKVGKPEAKVLTEMFTDIEELKRLERVYRNRGVMVDMKWSIEQIKTKIGLFIEQVRAGMTIGTSLDMSA